MNPGDRIIYVRMERPRPTEWPATYVRSQAVGCNARVMHVIKLDAGRTIQVSPGAIRSAS